MADVIWYNWSGRQRVPLVERWLRDYATRRGKTFRVIAGAGAQVNVDRIYTLVQRAQQVFMWGGHLPGQDLVKAMARKGGTRTYVFENGWFPQKANLHMDLSGIGGASSLCGDLGWVTPKMMERAWGRREFEYKLRGLHGGGSPPKWPRLCCLQVEQDAMTALYSRFQSTQAFVDFVERTYGECHFRPHPKSKASFIPQVGKILRGRSLVQDIVDHEQIIAINSTCLYEAAMMGRSVMPHGECPLSVHLPAGRLDKLLAAMVAVEIPKSTADITPWIELMDRRRPDP